MDDHIVEELLATLHDGGDPVAAAKRHALSLSEVANWSAGPTGSAAMAALRTLAQARSSLAVARSKVEAAKALLTLAQDTEARETARKACVDLLRLEEPPAPALGAVDASLTEEEHGAWLAALEQFGASATAPVTPASSLIGE